MKTFLLSLLAVVLIVEEWLWDILTALGHQLARWLHLAALEAWLAQAPPKLALLAFAVPVLIATPLNLLALWLLAHGLLLQAVVIEIGAKLVGTLLIARVFALTKPQLLSFAAFAWLYRTITGWLRWAHERIVATAAYRMLSGAKARAKAAFARLKGRIAAWRGTAPAEQER